MKVVGFANRKGGVGKTTLAVHVATELAQGELKVLVVGMDGNGNAIRWLSDDADVEDGDIIEQMRSNPNLTGMLSIEEYPKVLKSPKASKKFDVVVCDLNGECDGAGDIPADLWIVPVDCRQAIENFLSVQDVMAQSGDIWLVLNKADRAGKASLAGLRKAAEKIPDVTTWQHHIPLNASLKRATDKHQLLADDPYGDGSSAQKALQVLVQDICGQLGLKLKANGGGHKRSLKR